MAQQLKILKRVGVIGGGQLAWMMAGAAQSLGISVSVQTPSADDPAVSLATKTIYAEIEDAQATAELANHCDVITFENEFVDLESLYPLSQQGVCFRPRLEALSQLLDKYDQLCFLQELGLPVPQFQALTKGEEADAVLQKIEKTWGFPVVLKTRRHGYDGQGTFILKDEASLRSTWVKLGYPPVLLQEFIPFERELAIIAARSVTGEVAIYPVVETYQQNQVCRWVIAPANISPALTPKLEAIAHKLLNSLQAVGVFGIELFLTSEGQIYLNEIAPRTHNSGHFTLDACETSQFEQHLRAVSGLTLGNPQMNCGGVVMVNLLGYEQAYALEGNPQSLYWEKRQQLADIPRANVHWYGKTESRLGRKLGHVTVLLDVKSPDECQTQAIAIAKKVESIWYAHL
ncbi:5-(carboxyamino)imidazole ribonucleotide synthase [Limnoraphis robusta Tam1]|jgi:5-(carboxyamino)imidazole ribonucleotide synthase|uniref:N5-carboxyaminoimidazole ribonucleotide synthase n=1 Tax=Limnoraphis robusta CCNP1315 TaxID=3110306 RepID=A0ABU5U4Q4_9CYAN|nr:5-(carboxyamino)imidazole ribonucleotide synthase [Limnoraphis robusta]MEA5501496.1 5-(carboxyamino)imidazole ribonucleotide synthase [Limnoraphis robusta BA-68 BA1]MEA5522170.1 5-(carboxyamino)imidazole ribonucleotide synthase [Limnoraphis robusta CCNP1315]MEA5539250.1 5-(carboxyamino)imidazole ribonucleotide synthase [Limnoraphis robusta Tam1]MEA5544541.1 5-(carboxyamino)imidazole ribonucleotide synthase [Limnoraphis robusta CCNP1324]